MRRDVIPLRPNGRWYWPHPPDQDPRFGDRRPLTSLEQVLADQVAAYDARIGELEQIIRELACDCGPVDDPDMSHHARYCRARKALERGRAA